MAEPWYRAMFRGDYQRAWGPVLARFDSPAQAEFLGRALALQPGERVLDTVCGHGRHAVPLAQRGYAVTGADLSELEIERAREAAARAGVTARFLVRDMRELPFEGDFDAAYNVFTSFGFFEEAEDDARALRAFRRALRSGGRFFIDTINPLSLAGRFQARDWYRTDDGLLVLQERRWDLLPGAMHTTLTLLEGASSRTHEFFVRLYPPDTLRRALEAAGFRVTGAFGGWDAAPLLPTSNRLMLVAEAA